MTPNPYLDEYNALLERGIEARHRLTQKYQHYGKDWEFDAPLTDQERDERYLVMETWFREDGDSWQPHSGRDEMVARYSFAVPTEPALDLMASVAQGHGIVEIGAGNGYWAKLLADRGVDVLAFDHKPYVPWGGLRRLDVEVTQWYPVTKATEGVAGLHSTRVLFLCWPPYANLMALSALQAYEATGGDTLLYVGESSGGCTGDEAFHDQLCDGSRYGDDHDDRCDRSWHLETECEIPQWWGIHDALFIYRKSSPAAGTAPPPLPDQTADVHPASAAPERTSPC